VKTFPPTRAPIGILALALAVALLLPPGSSAGTPRVGSAAVDGIVLGPGGRPVVGAVVRLPAFSATATSGAGGRFAFARRFAASSPYHLIEAVVTATGFAPWRIHGVPLRPGQTLELRAELGPRSVDHTVRTPEEVAAARARTPSRPLSYTGTCTGWSDQLEPPSTITVWMTQDDPPDAKTYDFLFYATHVLPSEWIASWDADALGAGAIAVKDYAWYRTMPGHAYSSGTGCADLQDSTSDQVFDPTYSYPTTDLAVQATLGSTYWKAGGIFLAQYWAGYTTKDPCAAVQGEFAGRMSQWGSENCAIADPPMLWPDITDTFYDTADNTTWTYQSNLLLDPGAESPDYPWTNDATITVVPTEGAASEGSWFFRVASVAGKAGTFRNTPTYDGTSTTAYHVQVALRCRKTNTGSCTVVINLAVVKTDGSRISQKKTVVLANSGWWNTPTFDPAAYGADHVQVRFSVRTAQAVDVDAAVVTAPYGGA
jgi:hypothetical protein